VACVPLGVTTHKSYCWFLHASNTEAIGGIQMTDGGQSTARAVATYKPLDNVQPAGVQLPANNAAGDVGAQAQPGSWMYHLLLFS